MTRALAGQPAPLAVSRTSRGGGFVGLAWLTWRQHRWMIVAGVLGFGLVTGYLLWLDHEMGRLAALCNGPCSSQVVPDELPVYLNRADLVLSTLVLGSPLVAAFLAAPLVSREYEQRTNLLVWSQDVRAVHWLAAKTVLLATVAAVASAVLGFVANGLSHRVNDLANRRFSGSNSLFSGNYFEATPAMQVAYTLFGFALGLVISAVVRRTVPAMGITLAVFIATRVLVSWKRPYFMPPLHHLETLAQTGAHRSPWDGLGDNALRVGGGFADAAGNRVLYPTECNHIAMTAPRDGHNPQELCLQDHGVVSYDTLYQPGSRLGTFHLIEEGIFVGLAAVLFVLAWWRVRRATTIG